jgi:hypothetical protein
MPVAAPKEGHPRSEATRNSQAASSTEQGAGAVGIEREDMRGGVVDDGIPEFLRRKPNGAAS